MQLFSIIFTCLVASLLCQLIQSQEHQFKINKLNLIWHKAQHSLGPGKLKDLKNDLVKHEEDELNLKRMKSHNQDKDGLFEAAVRKKLLSIMAKYSIDRYFDDTNINNLTSKNLDTDIELNLPTFRDSKLDKLWKKAEKAGFDQEQLMLLHEEFQHYQDKLDAHYETLNIIEEELDKNLRKGDRQENSIDTPLEDGPIKTKSEKKRFKVATEKPELKKARLDENVQQELREKYHYIKKGYDELASKVKSGAIDTDKPFQEQPVNELWSLAQQSNFTDSELSSLKEELTHYQTRITKLKHFQNQFERNKLAAKESKSHFEEDPETKHLKKKLKELTKKVDKTHVSLERKIMRIEL